MPGTQTHRTIEVREIAGRLIDDSGYRARLLQRMIDGTAGPIEVLLWHYAKGKPVDRVETGQPGAFTDVSNTDLKARLTRALADI